MSVVYVLLFTFSSPKWQPKCPKKKKKKVYWKTSLRERKCLFVPCTLCNLVKPGCLKQANETTQEGEIFTVSGHFSQNTVKW